MRKVHEAWRLDPGSRFALWAIVVGVFGQVVILLGLVLGWWS